MLLVGFVSIQSKSMIIDTDLTTQLKRFANGFDFVAG